MFWELSLILLNKLCLWIKNVLMASIPWVLGNDLIMLDRNTSTSISMARSFLQRRTFSTDWFILPYFNAHCESFLALIFLRSRIHESTISLRFLGIILRVLILEVSVYNAYITNELQTTFARGWGVKFVVEMTVNSASVL